MINLYVAGVDQTKRLTAGTLGVTSRLNSRDRATFSLVSLDGTYRPTIGHEVVITDAGTTIAGTSATFSRPSAATIDGLDYTSGTPRYTGGGLLIEEGTINVLTNTDGAAATYTTGGAITNNPGAISNFAQALGYGDNTAIRFAYKTYAHTVGVTYTFSAFVQMDDGLAPVPGAQAAGADFAIVNHSAIVSTSSNCVVTQVSGSLYRVSITRAATGTAVNNGIVKYTQNSARTFKVTGYQLEIKGYLTSYAESGATSFTRSAESLTIPASGFTQGGWTAVATVKRSTTGLAGSANTLWECQIDGSNLWRMRLTAAGVLEAVIISGGTTYSITTTSTIASGIANRIAWSGDGSTALVAVNGTLVASFSYAEPIGTVPASISIGSGVSAVYSEIAINTRALDADALEALTAAAPVNVTSYWSLSSSLTGLDAQRIFGGSIESMREEVVVNQGVGLIYDIDCVSYDALADRRIIARSYESPTQTLSTIVNDIITQDFSGEGIDTANVATGPVIAKTIFNYTHGNTVFDQLAELTGYSWWIDPYKKLYFVDRSTVSAPYTLSTASANFMSVVVEHLRQDYRNRQYIKAGLGLTSARTENLVGDGTRKSFTLAYPVGKVPTSITVGGVSKTIGIREVESGKDWYWQAGSPVINQDAGAAAVGSGTAIAVTYQGQYPILVAAQDDLQVAGRASIEGGSGYYDEIQDEPDISDVDTASDRARALLRRYARINRKIQLRTVTAGLRAGQLATVDITQHGLTGSWLVESVSIRDFNGQRVEYSATLLDGEAVGGWQGFFGALSNQARKLEFRENEVILLLRQATEQVGITDSSSYTTAAPTAPLADVAICGFSELTS